MCNVFYSALHLGFPNEPAAIIALSTIKEWLVKNQQEVGEQHSKHSKCYNVIFSFQKVDTLFLPYISGRPSHGAQG